MSLLITESFCITESAEMAWMCIRFSDWSQIAPLSISLVTKAIARISRISEELNQISLIRFMISVALRGISWRSSGLMWTTTTSGLSQW